MAISTNEPRIRGVLEGKRLTLNEIADRVNMSPNGVKNILNIMDGVKQFGKGGPGDPYRYGLAEEDEQGEGTPLVQRSPQGGTVTTETMESLRRDKEVLQRTSNKRLQQIGDLETRLRDVERERDDLLKRPGTVTTYTDRSDEVGALKREVAEGLTQIRRTEEELEAARRAQAASEERTRQAILERDELGSGVKAIVQALEGLEELGDNPVDQIAALRERWAQPTATTQYFGDGTTTEYVKSLQEELATARTTIEAQGQRIAELQAERDAREPDERIVALRHEMDEMRVQYGDAQRRDQADLEETRRQREDAFHQRDEAVGALNLVGEELKQTKADRDLYKVHDDESQRALDALREELRQAKAEVKRVQDEANRFHDGEERAKAAAEKAREAQTSSYNAWQEKVAEVAALEGERKSIGDWVGDLLDALGVAREQRPDGLLDRLQFLEGLVTSLAAENLEATEVRRAESPPEHTVMLAQIVALAKERIWDEAPIQPWEIRAIVRPEAGRPK